MTAPLELSACIELLFVEGGRPFADRIRAAREAGLPAVEFWSWRDKPLEDLERALDDTGLAVTSFVSEPAGGLVDTSTHRAFLDGLVESCAVAQRLAVPNLVVLAGDALPGVDTVRQRDAVVAALRTAAPIAADHGIVLTLEPLNTRVDHPGHFLDRTADGMSIVREVDHPGLRLLYDLYHSVVMDERPAEVLRDAMDLVGHVQIADVPGRHEPGSGTIAWADEIATLRRIGYRGRLGLEYVPEVESAASLGTIRGVVAQLA
jgi:hydroxypyruvate isomerase